MNNLNADTQQMIDGGVAPVPIQIAFNILAILAGAQIYEMFLKDTIGNGKTLDYIDDVALPPAGSMSNPTPTRTNLSNGNVIQTPLGPVSPIKTGINLGPQPPIATPKSPVSPVTPVTPVTPVNNPIKVGPINKVPVVSTPTNPVVVEPNVPVSVDTPSVVVPVADEVAVVQPEETVKTAGFFSDNKLLMGVLIGAAVYALVLKK